MISRAMTPVQAERTELTISGCVAQSPVVGGDPHDRAAILRGRRAPRCALGVLVLGLTDAPALVRALAAVQRRFDEFAAGDPADRLFEDLVTDVHLVLREATGPTALVPDASLAALLVRPQRIDWCNVGSTRTILARGGRVARRWAGDPLAGGTAPSALVSSGLGGSRAPYPQVAGLRDPADGDTFLLCPGRVGSVVSDDEVAKALACGVPRDALAAITARAAERAIAATSLVLLRLERPAA